MYPIPKFLQYHDGVYAMGTCCADCDLLAFYNLVKAGAKGIKVQNVVLFEKEEYLLTVDENGATLTVSCDEGLFRAATTLYQMIREHQGNLPFVTINDKPDLKRRGYMLDISRSRMPKVALIKRYIDLLALLKYNEFQLYMEVNCFKYSAYPKYTEGFDCLTPEDIEELDQYCADRFIDLVPNQNSLGHMGYWLKQDEFKHLALGDETHTESTTVNPLLPETMEFLDNLYGSLLPHFRSEWLNVGMDEAFELGKFQMEQHTKMYGKDIAFMEHLNRVDKLARDKYGKKIMFWADMIYKYKDLYNMIPRDAIALEWGYELIQSQVMTAHCIEFQQAGVKYYVCPSCNTHLSFTGRFDVTSFNIRTAAEIARDYGAEGLLMTDWANTYAPHFPVWSMVPMALAGQYGWNIGAEQNGETFKAEFIHAAEKFVNFYVFGCEGVSRLLYRMANYYLLEPERIHVGTMCGEIFFQPLNETLHAPYFDLAVCGDDFYFDNVIGYVNNILKDIEALPICDKLKRQIAVNAKMVVLSAEHCKIRMSQTVSEEKKAELVALSDWIAAEFKELWLMDNYEEGVQNFLGVLETRKQELLAL